MWSKICIGYIKTVKLHQSRKINTDGRRLFVDPFWQGVADVNGAINGVVWGIPMLILIVGTGLFLSIRNGFFQFGKFGHAMRNTLGSMFKKREASSGAVTPFQAVTTALAATVGTGNIAGVAGALALGGPGAIFWMWISALVGMITKYSEVVLSIRFRQRNKKGDWVGGPMYYILNGLGKHWKWLAIVFCVLGALAAFGIGNATQVNTIASSIVTAANSLAGDPAALASSELLIRIIIGIVIAVITGMVIIGGVKRIGRVTEKLVPIMSVLYILFALIIIFANIGNIGVVLGMIFAGAFNPQAILGGVVGATIVQVMRSGVARGVFSNEAGLGSAPIAHAAADTDNPVKQGLFGIFEVFMDTIVICTLTALVILMSGAVVPWGASAGADLTTAGFSTLFGPQFSSIFMAVCILLFALSTILSWSLYGTRCIEFIFGSKSIIPYQIIFVLFTIVGATMDIGLAWDIADTLNGLMAIPNIIALLALSGVVVKLTRDYRKELRQIKLNRT